MVILFVCKWNVGRSQIAEELFNSQETDHIGLSAGTHAEKYKGKKLDTVAPLVVEILKEKNIDVSKKIPLQLTSEMVKFADKIIVMADKKDMPPFLAESDKLVFWDIEDGGGRDYEFHMLMRAQIERRVKDFIASLG